MFVLKSFDINCKWIVLYFVNVIIMIKLYDGKGKFLVWFEKY